MKQGERMLRSAVIGVLAVVAGLVLSIGAFAAPFRAFQAAEDQYTTPTTTTTPGTTTTAPGTTPPAVTTTVGVTVGRTTSTPTTPATPKPERDDDRAGTLDASGGGGDPVAPNRSGVSPANASGTGAPGTGTGAGTGSGSGGGSTIGTPDGRSNIAFLSIGDAPDKLRLAFIEATGGLPQWSADVDRATRDDRLTGKRMLKGMATPLGTGSVGADATAKQLPDLLDRFDGTVEPIVGLVLARRELPTDAEQQRGDAFVKAFAAGAVKQGIPVVGIDLKGTDPNNTPYFKSIEGVSSVDDIDTKAGKESLVRLLAGAKPGHYGTDENAAAKTPPAVSADRSAATFSSGTGDQSPLTVLLLLALMGLSARALLTVGRRARLRLR